MAEMAMVGLPVDPSGIMGPAPQANEADALGPVSSQTIARAVYQDHVAALRARRGDDLIREKYLLHVDGEGDLQWADIFNNEKVRIPTLVSEFQKTENLLRILVDNAVAFHTTMPLRYFASSNPDWKSRNQAILDSLWANYLSMVQDFNGLFAEALYLAMPAGFCPTHAWWRDDVEIDWYEPLSPGAQELVTPDPVPGMIDCFVGNPFATTFNRGATRGNAQWCTYERLLNADRVRSHFNMPHLEGTTRIPSASIFQRIARDWMVDGLGVHGDPTIAYRRATEFDEEMIVVLCREDAPGPQNGWAGRFRMVAVPGAVDLRRGDRDISGRVELLADQPLPGRDWSWENVYSHHRGNDIHGKPWVADLDQLQVDLNIAISKRWEIVNKMAEAPIVTPGGAITDDMADIGGYNLLEVEPSLGTWRPRVMEWPANILGALDNEVAEKRQALYTIGGYQAASRGESPGSRTPYRAIVALQQADNTIHGPVNQRFRRFATNFMGRCWSQFKMYGDVPWLLEVAGDEYAYLTDFYIDKTRLSPHPPTFQLVNAFGPSPEMHAQEILELLQVRGADGQPFLRTDEARRQYPNSMIFDDAGNPAALRRRHAKTVRQRILDLAEDFREQTQFGEMDPAHPWVQQAGMFVFQIIERQYPRRRDDDLEAHLSTLSEITQDDTADPIAQVAATIRQNLYYAWQEQMALASGPIDPRTGQPQGAQGPGRRSEMDPRQVASEMGGRGGGSGTTLSDVSERSGAREAV